MSQARGPFALSALETQPPFAFETAEKGVSPVDGGGEVRVAGMDERPRSLAAEPAVPVRELLDVARVEATPHGRRPLPPRVGEQPLQNPAEAAVAGRDLHHLAHRPGARVVEVPADESASAFEHGTRAELAVTRLARCLVEKPGERA